MYLCHLNIKTEGILMGQIKFISFGSGSSGNCYYLGNGEDAILIDAGIGIRRIKRYLKEYGIKSSEIKGVIITHDHADHVKAVGYVSQEMNLPVYSTDLIHKGMNNNIHTMKKVDAGNQIFINQYEPFQIAGFRITAFPIPHDSTENMGYLIEVNDRSFCIMTDVGMPTETVQEYIRKANYLVIEANYDEEMLRTGKYPQLLKDRISSGTGHMSNHQTAKALADNFHEGLSHVWLCHLSEENNHPELARKTIEYHLRSFGIIAGKDFQLEVLRRLIPTGPFFLNQQASEQ